MKRRSPTPRIKEQSTPAANACPSDTPHTSTNRLYSAPLRLKRGRKVSYVPGELPKEEPPDAPRLFVRGIGGSVKTDLSGVGTRLSSAAFAHHVADHSLESIHIRQGDIVLIEPSYRALRAGNLVLLEIDCRTVFRRLTKKNRIWYLNPMGNVGSEPVPLIDQPLQGVAVGFLRLFAPLKPVKFRTADTNCEISFLRSGSEATTKRERRAACVMRSSSKTEHAKSSRSPAMLAAEKEGKFRLSEVDKKSAYKAWPNTR